MSHTINSPAEFWGYTQKYLLNISGDGVQKLISVFPNENMDQCTCIWEADAIEELDEYIRNKVGNTSKNSYYQINEANSIGLTT